MERTSVIEKFSVAAGSIRIARATQQRKRAPAQVVAEVLNELKQRFSWVGTETHMRSMICGKAKGLNVGIVCSHRFNAKVSLEEECSLMDKARRSQMALTDFVEIIVAAKGRLRNQ